MNAAFRWWWSWVGPDAGPFGFLGFVASLFLIVATFTPPLFWVLRTVFGWWFRFWLG